MKNKPSFGSTNVDDTTSSSSSSSLSGLSFLNRTFTPSPSDTKQSENNKRRRSIKFTPSSLKNNTNGKEEVIGVFDLVPSSSKNKPQWNFDELSSSLLSTSDLLERIESQISSDSGKNGKDNSSTSSLVPSPALQDISNNNSNIKSLFMTSNNGKVDFDRIKKQTELIKQLTDRMKPGGGSGGGLSSEGAKRVIPSDDTIEILPISRSDLSTDDKSTTSSSSSSSSPDNKTTQDYNENETESSFQFPLQLWKKSNNNDDNDRNIGNDDDKKSTVDSSTNASKSMLLGPPMRKNNNGETKEVIVSSTILQKQQQQKMSIDEKSKEDDSFNNTNSAGCNSYGSLFRNSSSSASSPSLLSSSLSSSENNDRRKNASYISTESELTYDNNESSHDSLKLSSSVTDSTVDSDFSNKSKTSVLNRRPPRSPATNLSSSSMSDSSSLLYDTGISHDDDESFANKHASFLSPSKKKTSNKRPPRSPNAIASSSSTIVDSPSRNTRSKKSRIGPSPPIKKSSSSRSSPRKTSYSSPSRSSPRRRSSPRKDCTASNDDSPARNTRQHKRLSLPSTSTSNLSPAINSKDMPFSSVNNSILSSPNLSFFESSISTIESTTKDDTTNKENINNSFNTSSTPSLKNTTTFDLDNNDSHNRIDKINELSIGISSHNDNTNKENMVSNMSNKSKKIAKRRETADTETLNNLMLDLQEEVTILKKTQSDENVTADLADLHSLSLLENDPPTVTFNLENKQYYVDNNDQNDDTPPPSTIGMQKSCNERLHTPYLKSSSSFNNDVSIMLNESTDNIKNTSIIEEKGDASYKPLRSILNSNRKQQRLSKKISNNNSIVNSTRKKTIAFGSPEVAEFNSNSPSGNFTPLPARQARALFKIPSPHNESSSSDDCFDSTSSPINKVDDTTTIEVEGDVNSLLNNTAFDYRNCNNKNSKTDVVDNTVELEINVEEIMQQGNLNSTENSTNNSMNMDQTGESDTTRSIHNTTTMSPIAESRELSDSSESMLFSPYSPCSPSILKEDRNSIASLNVNPFNDESILDGDSILCGKSLNFEEHIATNEASEFSSTSYETKNISTSSVNDEFPPIGASIISHEKDVMNFLTSVAATNKSSVSMNEDNAIIRNLANNTEAKMKSSWIPAAVSSKNNMTFGIDDSCITNHNTHTYELEGNMEELVNCEKHLNESRDLKSVPGASSEALHLKQMRRLTLTSPSKSRVAIMTDENTNQSYVSIEIMETASQTKRNSFVFNKRDSVHQHPATNISYDDILVDAGLDKPMEVIREVLINACEIPCQSRNWYIGNTANSFLSAVCNEVKEKANTSTVDNFDEAFKGNIKQIILSSQEKRGYDLQKHLKRQLVELVKRIYSNVSSEWMEWELQVTAALNDNISRLYSDAENEECTARIQMNLIDDAFESIAMTEEKLIRKARRKSQNRRKNALTQMKEEIVRLELELKKKQKHLELVEREKELVSNLEDQLNNHYMLKSKVEKGHKNADDFRWRFRNVERMHSWVLVSTDPSASNHQIELHFQGQLKETCAILIISLISPHVISCTINQSTYPKSFRKTLAFKCSSQIKNYVTTCVLSLCNQLDKTRIQLSTERSLKSAVQRKVNFWESSLCRIEIGSQELSSILNRYDATLQREENKFSITINYRSNNRTRVNAKKLNAKFLFDERYPFCFMEIHLEALTEGIKIDYLVRLLNARVKPGYRYLSRACELTDSFLNS